MFGKITAVAAIVALLGAALLVIGANVQPDRPQDVPSLAHFAPDPNSVYDPVAAGEQLPDGYRNTLGRDDILPVYDPAMEPGFVSAGSVDWSDESLVLGLEIEGEAKAYPIAFLNRREMVVDSLAGVPVLVTW